MKDMRLSMNDKYIIDAVTGKVYIPAKNPIMIDLPEPIRIKYFTCVHRDKDMIVLAPGTEVIDVSSLHMTEYGVPNSRKISFDTDLPVIYNNNQKVYLLQGDPIDSSYDLMDQYVHIQDEKDDYIPIGKKYLNLIHMHIGDYNIEKLPYEQFCRDRGIEYGMHIHNYIRFSAVKRKKSIDLDEDLVQLE